jgi:hypothetical protein
MTPVIRRAGRCARQTASIVASPADARRVAGPSPFALDPWLLRMPVARDKVYHPDGADAPAALYDSVAEARGSFGTLGSTNSDAGDSHL